VFAAYLESFLLSLSALVAESDLEVIFEFLAKIFLERATAFGLRMPPPPLLGRRLLLFLPAAEAEPMRLPI
jgi:hypothetical protein